MLLTKKRFFLLVITVTLTGCRSSVVVDFGGAFRLHRQQATTTLTSRDVLALAGVADGGALEIAIGKRIAPGAELTAEDFSKSALEQQRHRLHAIVGCTHAFVSGANRRVESLKRASTRRSPTENEGAILFAGAESEDAEVPQFSHLMSETCRNTIIPSLSWISKTSQWGEALTNIRVAEHKFSRATGVQGEAVVLEEPVETFLYLIKELELVRQSAVVARDLNRSLLARAIYLLDTMAHLIDILGTLAETGWSKATLARAEYSAEYMRGRSRPVLSCELLILTKRVSEDWVVILRRQAEVRIGNAGEAVQIDARLALPLELSANEPFEIQEDVFLTKGDIDSSRFANKSAPAQTQASNSFVINSAATLVYLVAVINENDAVKLEEWVPSREAEALIELHTIEGSEPRDHEIKSKFYLERVIHSPPTHLPQ
jgi:hypothetical protein